MKRIIIFCLSLSLLLACVPTPEEEVVLNKAEGRLEAAITETTPVPAYETEQIPVQPGGTEPTAPQGSDPVPTDEPRGTLRTALGAPEHCTDSAEDKVVGGTLTVTVDADVEIPNVSKVPVYTAEIRTFTPEQCEKITKLLLGDGPYYNYNRELGDKAHWKRVIEEQTKLLDDFNNRVFGEDFPYDQYQFDTEFNLNQYLASYAEMPEPGPMQPWTGSFSGDKTVVANENNCYLAITTSSIFFYDETNSAPDPYGGHMPQTADEKEAAAVAESVMREISGGAFKAVGVSTYLDGFDREPFLREWHLSPEQFPADEYHIALIRNTAGIPCYSYSAFHGADTAMQAAGASVNFDEPVIPESAAVLVRNGKAVALTWYNAINVMETENENVGLISFDKAMEIFKKQIFRSIYLDAAEKGKAETHEHITVTRIVLSYMKVKKKDAPDERYLLPVWDFMGYTDEGSREWFKNQSLLTVNAIDGSIIDRNSGY